MPRLLYLFSLINLVIGSSAFVITGIIVPIAKDLGVGVPAAGQAMSAYAIGTALLAPLLLLATGRWPRKRVLLLALALFTLGNMASALAHTLPQLLAARVLLGAGAVFVPVAAGIAVALAPPAQRGKALSLVFLGMSMSYVVGVPLGAWLGLEFGWQAPLWLAAACAGLAWVSVAVLVPAAVQAPGASFAGLGTLLKRGDVASAMGVTLLYFGGIFSVFSFIAPVLQALSPMPGHLMSLTLMCFGFSGVAGTLIGGWATDRFGNLPTMRWLLAQFLLSMLLLPLTQGHYAAMLLCFLVWGVAGFGLMAPQQSRLVSIAAAQAPVLLSLNSSMMYFGMALGAALGGAAVAAIGFERLSWAGAPLAAAALVLLVYSAPRDTVARPAAT